MVAPCKVRDVEAIGHIDKRSDWPFVFLADLRLGAFTGIGHLSSSSSHYSSSLTSAGVASLYNTPP